MNESIIMTDEYIKIDIKKRPITSMIIMTMTKPDVALLFLSYTGIYLGVGYLLLNHLSKQINGIEYINQINLLLFDKMNLTFI